MFISKVKRVANGAASRAPSAPRRTAPARPTSNPAHMLTLGFVNPKTGGLMATAAKKKKSSGKSQHRASNKSAGWAGGKSVATRNNKLVVITPAQNHKKRPKKRNPEFFGTHASGPQIAEYVAGGLIGVTVNRLVLPILPASITGNNLAATAAAVAIALAEWWAGSFVNKSFGAAVGFGALMNAGSQALNTFVPSIGAKVSLSGRRGHGDFVPGSFAVPQNPISDGNPNMNGGAGLMHMAYPSPYSMN